MSALAITGIGMVTGVGLSAPTSCAAIRAAVDNFQRTAFRDDQGAWLTGSEVRLEKPWRGAEKLLQMAAASVRETLGACPDVVPASTPMILCLPEADRPGRPLEDDAGLLHGLQRELGLAFNGQSAAIARGRVSVAIAIDHAGRLLATGGVNHVLIVATDSLLVGRTLKDLEQRRHLLTRENSDGCIPGEAAASFVITRARNAPGTVFACLGVGFGVEEAHIDSGEPLRADGLTTAIKGALQASGCLESMLKFKIFDASGAQYQFKESSIAYSRVDRTKRQEFDVWHPADCVGEIGAAIGPVMVGALATAFEKGYAQGDHVLMHVGNDAGQRAALIFAWQNGSA